VETTATRGGLRPGGGRASLDPCCRRSQRRKLATAADVEKRIVRDEARIKGWQVTSPPAAGLANSQHGPPRASSKAAAFFRRFLPNRGLGAARKTLHSVINVSSSLVYRVINIAARRDLPSFCSAMMICLLGRQRLHLIN
jgi:hypothetical protein